MWLNSQTVSLGLVYVSGLIFKRYQTESIDRGFGKDIAWIYLDKAIAEAKSSNLPVMVIIHKSWCGACKALKPLVAASSEIKELSRGFVMVNCADDEEPRDIKYAPDGSYIPRILFLNERGDLMPEYYNEYGDSRFKYYYRDASSIANVMRKVLNRPKPTVPQSLGPSQPLETPTLPPEQVSAKQVDSGGSIVYDF